MTLSTVVGATGFVGARLTAALQRDGREVYAPRRGDPALFERELGHVYYCAGLTADYLKRPFDSVEAHVGLIARLLETGRFERLVYLSSTRLYDSLGADAGAEDGPLMLRPAEPRHLYDLSKGLGESLCLTQSGGRAAVARLSCVFDHAPGAPGFLSEWLALAGTTRDIRLASSSGYVRDYIHLDDTVAALRAIVDTGAAGVFNVASGENLSNADLAAAFEAQGWRVAFERETPRQGAPLCDTARLRALGVEPRPAREVVASVLKEMAVAAG